MIQSRLLLTLLIFAAAAPCQTDLTGGWAGTFDRPGPSRQSLLIEFAHTPQGWAGAADISAWSSAATLTAIRFDGTHVSFEATTETDPGHWVFRADVSETGDRIEGTVALGPDEWPFRLSRHDYALGLLASSSESVGEFNDGFAGRWYSEIPMADGSRLQFVLRRTAYGFAASREVWGSGGRLHRIEITGNSLRFEMPNARAPFAVLDPEGKYFKDGPPPVFEGVLDAEAMNITGVWSEGVENQPFTLHRYIGEPGLGH